MSLASAVGDLGAPGIYVATPEPVRVLTGVRRDGAAFLGVAPRGPAWMPAGSLEPDDDVATWLATRPRRRSLATAVTSWDEYRRQFGGYEGPGRLPYAVSTFFASGGERAYVVRIVHEHGDRFADAPGRASGRFRLGGADLKTKDGDPVDLFARSEGRWGDGLRATLSFRVRPLTADVLDLSHLVVDVREWVPAGSLLRLDLGGDVEELRYVDASIAEPDPAGAGRRRVLTLAAPAALLPRRVELVTAELEVVDHDPACARHERIVDLGLRAEHPRWLARVLITESRLAWPGAAWVGGAIDLTDASLPSLALVGADGGVHMAGGVDSWDAVVPEDFWDAQWVPGDELPGDGVQSLTEWDDIGLVVAPDLYDPAPIPPIDDVADVPTLCGPDFAAHVELPAPMPVPPVEAGLVGLALDPSDAAQLARIVANQQALADFADARRDHTLLLDVPPGLTQRRVLAWRTRFDSPFVAAYHPWLDVAAPDDDRDALIRLNPSAFAAGITAEREIRLGVQHGPANEIAIGALRAADRISREWHAALHRVGVNVFLPERDGIRLTAARTLSRRDLLRQLSVARLMTVLRLTLERELQWAVFEPNGLTLWADVRRLVHGLLTRLFEAGAFQGATTQEAFFVRCDRSTMTTNDLDNGRLVCLVGVAPAEPIEYLVLEISLVSTAGVVVEIAG